MTMKVVVASEPDREDLFAEIHQDDQPWAEIALDRMTKRFVLTIFPSATDDAHVFPLSEAVGAIAEARDALTRRGYVEE